jgi:soluble cytochrome b562
MQSTLPVSQKLSPAAQSVQKSINEANVILTAAANVLSQQVADGILSKPDAQAYLSKIKGYAADVDKAQDLLAKGLILDAKNQAEILSKLVVALHKEIASRRKQ